MKQLVISIILVMAIAMESGAGWFSNEYWVITYDTIRSSAVTRMRTEDKDAAISYAKELKESGQYNSVSVGIGPCKTKSGPNGIYLLCDEFILMYANLL